MLYICSLFKDSKAFVHINLKWNSWLDIDIAVCPGFVLSPCLFNLYIDFLLRIFNGYVGVTIENKYVR